MSRIESTAIWILIGMMGSGKSTIGRELARHSEREFLDTDQLLRQRFGRSIPGIFQLYGEEAFRAHETNILRSLQPHAAVLSTGGGIVLSEENWSEMRRLGVSIFIDSEPEILIERLEKTRHRRPLLQADGWEDKIREILNSRRSLYARADIHVRIEEEGIEKAVASVWEALQSKK